MKLTITALIDEDVRKQVREEILGEARKVSRSVLDGAINKELERLAKQLENRWKSKDYHFNAFVTRILEAMLKDNWTEIRKRIDAHVELAADKVVSAKLNKLDDEDTRKIVKEELAKLLTKSLKG